MLFLCLYALLGAKRVHRIIMATIFTVSWFIETTVLPAHPSKLLLLQIMLIVSLALTLTQIFLYVNLGMSTSGALS